MGLKICTDKLTPAEASFVAWQFGYQDEDDPFFISLWHTINRAWISDNKPATEMRQLTRYLTKLAAAGAYPEEVAIFLKFKSEQGEKYWLDMLQRAGLADRRQRSLAPSMERRRRTAAT